MSDPRDDLPIKPPHDPPAVLDAQSAQQSRPFYPGLPTGTGLGKYRILERIRSYHNAVVYKARDLMLDRLVAVKQMTPELIDSPIACGNFRREAQFLARIPKDSRYTLNIHELIEDGIGLFIVEEYIPGHWLESLIFKRQIDVSGAYKILKTAALGLRTLHNLMIVHRDIQPGNLMITKNGGAKIANFASAAQEGDLGPPPVITPQYAAPELLLEKRYDDRVDLYGLGMSVYEVCVGRQAMERHFSEIYESPFPVGKWIEWQTDLARHLPDASELNPLVPPALTAILRRMTAKNLDQRYRSIDEVLEALAVYFTGPGNAAPGRMLDAPTDESRSKSRRQRLLPHLDAPQPARQAYDGPTAEPVAPRTSTHTVRSARQRFRDESRWEWAPDQPAETVAGPRARNQTWGRARKAPRSFAPPRPQHVIKIPPPPKAKPVVHRKQTPRILAWTVTFLFLMVGGGAAGYVGWYHNYGPGAIHPIEPILEKGIAAYEAGRFAEAEQIFAEAAKVDLKDREAVVWGERTRFWMELVQAQLALARDEYEFVHSILRDASRRGINPAKVDELQQKAWLKRDAQRLASEGMQDMAKGNLPAVEAKLEEYAEKAAAVGLDPSRLEDSLRETKQDLRQREHLQKAADALKAGNYIEAIIACEQAERIQVSSATRELRTAITNAQKRSEWSDKGDQAMTERAFVEAEKCYSRALLIGPDIETERKSRLARAYVLFEEAREAIGVGNLLEGEGKLKSSLWNTPTGDAQTMLTRMRPAFDAARLVRRGDRRAEDGEFEKARANYERALPMLPPPADKICREKIVGIQRRKLIWEGDQALKDGDRATAEHRYLEARKLAPGDDVDDRLDRLSQPTSNPNR